MTAKLYLPALLLLGLLSLFPVTARADGKMNWSGDVDDKVEVVIRGRTAVLRNISGDRPQNVSSHFDDGLPARDVRVELDRRDGRGQITIVERPNRNNGYAAVVRIQDSEGGSSRYRFTLRWDNNGGGNGGNHNGNNGGNHGGNGGGWDNNVGNNAIRWSGRVDGTNDVRVQGNNVKWFKVEGGGATDVHYRVGDPLPAREVNVRINKRRGRGSVYVLTRPGRQNNYTLTVRVVDKDSGDDTYDFTINW